MIRFIKTLAKLLRIDRSQTNWEEMFYLITINLYQDVNNTNILTFIEEWKSMEAIEKHNASEHFKKIVPQMNELSEPSTEVNLYE